MLSHGYPHLTTYYIPATVILPVLIIFSADHIERFNNAWQKESETESNDLRQNGRNIWDEFKKVQILGSGAFGAVVLSQKSSQPDQEKVTTTSGAFGPHFTTITATTEGAKESF